MNDDYDNWLAEQIRKNEFSLKVVGICISVIIVAAIVFAITVSSAIFGAAFESFF